MATHITFSDDVYSINAELQKKIKKRHASNPNPNFKIEDIRYRTNGNVGVYYIRMEANAEKYLIDDRLVDVIHLTRYYVNGKAIQNTILSMFIAQKPINSYWKNY